MKTYSYLSAFLLIFTLTITASAQNYPVLKAERIYTPWDEDTTLIDYSRYGIANITEDGKLVMLAYPYPEHKLRFYLYNDIQKTWITKYIDSNTSINQSLVNSYSVGLKRVGSMVYKGTTHDSNYIGTRWIFNYGDSVFWDTAKMPFYPANVIMISPMVSYYSTKHVWPRRRYGNDGYGPMLSAYDSYLYKRFYVNGKDSLINLLSLSGSFAGYSSNDQYYENDLYFTAVDEETVATAIRRKFWEPGLSGSQSKSGNEEYNTKTTTSGKSWQKSEYNPYNLPSEREDNQWFINIEPATYLYSSPRHGITPKKPAYYGFIDDYIENVEVLSQYGNGKKGYYCLCNSKTDSAETSKFIIYSIDYMGELQKFMIPNSVFEYKDAPGYITYFRDQKIIYADDTIMYVQVTVLKGDGNIILVKSQPQVYKIYLKEIVNSIAEQPSAAPLQPYPNPTDQTLHWNTATGTAVITDAFGRVLIEVPASAMEADVSELAVGMYFLTIRNGMESAVRSFVVVR